MKEKEIDEGEISMKGEDEQEGLTKRRREDGKIEFSVGN